MTDEKHNSSQSLLDKFVSVLPGSPWLEVVQRAWKIIRKTIQRRSHPGLYEVLDYESTLELKDGGGERATFKKREEVRYLQDNIIAYQDQAWGDGEILLKLPLHPRDPGGPLPIWSQDLRSYFAAEAEE